jgi:hypothetical protein
MAKWPVEEDADQKITYENPYMYIPGDAGNSPPFPPGARPGRDSGHQPVEAGSLLLSAREIGRFGHRGP